MNNREIVAENDITTLDLPARDQVENDIPRRTPFHRREIGVGRCLTFFIRMMW